MNYNSLLQSIQHVKNGVAPEPNFLASLRPIPKEDLEGLGIPEKLKEFLTQVGLPIEVRLAREPEKMDDQDVPSDYFPLDKFSMKKIDRSTYLSIGGCRSKNIYDIYNSDNIFLSEYLVDISTGNVWRVNDDDLKFDGDVWHFTDPELGLQFVNSSLEQFVLSMACWKSFYPQFEKTYLEVDGDLGYIFDHDELYEPFLNTMEILDAQAIENEFHYWSFMCDLSLY